VVELDNVIKMLIMHRSMCITKTQTADSLVRNHGKSLGCRPNDRTRWQRLALGQDRNNRAPGALLISTALSSYKRPGLG
jgi:hypothetical protein